MHKKKYYKGTWVSPDDNTINQIDHILIEKAHTNQITEIRRYRGADLNRLRISQGGNEMDRSKCKEERKRKRSSIWMYKNLKKKKNS